MCLISFFNREAWVAARKPFCLGAGKGDPLAPGVASISSRRPGAESPASICRQWHSYFREPDAGNVVAIAVGLRDQDSIDGCLDLWWQNCENSLTGRGPEVIQVARVEVAVVDHPWD